MTRNTRRSFLPLAFLAVSTLAARAQEPNPTSVAAPQSAAVVTQNGDIFFYKVTAVRQNIDAVNYLHRSGSTHLSFVGTNALPEASGKAEVKSERGKITVDADFRGLKPANSFGPDFLTYVLWAISPDGNPKNLGEVLPAGTKNNISVSVPIQAFGLIVTAEPYYAVSTPSDVVVLKNVFDNTLGVQEHVDAHAMLMPHGVYAAATDGSKTIAHPITRDEKSPLELYEAYNAVQIATAAGSAKYSPDILAKAQASLNNAAQMDSNKHRNDSDTKMEITFARASVESAEDARVDTLRKEAAERSRNQELAKEKAQQDAANSQAQAQASQAQAQASQAMAAAAAAQSERDRLAAENARLQAQQASLAKANADAAAAAAREKEREANAAAAAANARAANAEQMREKLRAQLNARAADYGDSARPDRQPFRCPLRQRQIHVEAGNAGFVGSYRRHLPVLS